jgi:hypothetical protein
MYSPSLRKDEFFTISIKHLPTGNRVSFEGWVTEFSDTFNSNWSSTPVYGRMDPLATFEGTQRTITLGFDVVSDGIGTAVQNLENINTFIEFLYPMYDTHLETENGGIGARRTRRAQTTLKAAPLLGVKWTNLFNAADYRSYLYGYIQGGVSYAPAMAEGGFILKKGQGEPLDQVLSTEDQINIAKNTFSGDERSLSDPSKISQTKTIQVKKNSYIPKKVSLNFTFNVLHTHLVGWDERGIFGGRAGITNRFPNSNTSDAVIGELQATQFIEAPEGSAFGDSEVTVSAGQTNELERLAAAERGDILE